MGDVLGGADRILRNYSRDLPQPQIVGAIEHSAVGVAPAVNQIFARFLGGMKGKFRGIGQPVIIPGSMGTSSYVLIGTDEGMRETFGSVCHGAGRVMSRHSALGQKDGRQVKAELEAKGEEIRVQFVKGLAEEMPEAYKNIDDVIESVELAGLAKKVSRHVPMGVMKG